MTSETHAEERGQRPRGRPPGRTPEGERTRTRLFETAVAAMAEHGFEGTTLRGIAAEAGITHAALYRHFPSKQALVLALYEKLSLEFAMRTQLRGGRWSARVLAATTASLETLRPHRETLRALIPILVSRREEGLFAPATADARERVAGLFQQAVDEATDAPVARLRGPLGRLAYGIHLAVILFWLLDASPRTQATDQLLVLLGRLLRLGAGAVRLPGVPGLLQRADRILVEGLLTSPVLEMPPDR